MLDVWVLLYIHFQVYIRKLTYMRLFVGVVMVGGKMKNSGTTRVYNSKKIPHLTPILIPSLNHN